MSDGSPGGLDSAFVWPGDDDAGLRVIIFNMLPFCIYFVASVITGFQVYTLLTPAIYGAPWDPLELVSLLGSLCLLIAAYVSLFKPYAAARLALIGCLAIWCFYGPAIAKSIGPKLDGKTSILEPK